MSRGINLKTKTLHVLGKGGEVRVVRFGNETGLALARYIKAQALHTLADSPSLRLAAWSRTRCVPRVRVIRVPGTSKPAGAQRSRGGMRGIAAGEAACVARSSKSVPAGVDIRMRVCVVFSSSREER
ncbi:hypothetical protein Acsp05_43560 [Actinokineospora sp. NBRC 105648]|nr:hypothetical protein Acsp05_43560 [Actinokineospora sp. NBRC 105648]